jgi:antirestriction protein ArdC
MASEKQKAKVRQATELLERGVEDVFTSGRMAEYLTVMSRFHSYSARNCMLILMQKPEATRVAGYKAWRQKFNRQVRKGERSITILAPIAHKTTIRETNKDTGEVTDHEHVWMSFKAVPVFDVSQTDGDELPEIATDLTGDVERFDRLCKAIEGAATVPVTYGAEFSDPEVHGSFNRFDKVIKVRGGMSEAQTLKTLVHETAHSILHCEGGEQVEAERNVREVQAEGVAFVVCKALGIDTEDYSLGYVAAWSGMDSKAVLGQLEVIRKTANAILDKVA